MVRRAIGKIDWVQAVSFYGRAMAVGKQKNSDFIGFSGLRRSRLHRELCRIKRQNCGVWSD